MAFKSLIMKTGKGMNRRGKRGNVRKSARRK